MDAQYGSHWFCPHCNEEIKAGELKVVTPRTHMLDIVRVVSFIHGIEVRDILGKRRIRTIVDARHEAIQTIHARFPKISSVQIGKFFDMDHSSILFALGHLKKHSKRVALANGSSTAVHEIPIEPTNP
jgi:chromosomal replication initiation ATPase DnaA